MGHTLVLNREMMLHMVEYSEQSEVSVLHNNSVDELAFIKETIFHFTSNFAKLPPYIIRQYRVVIPSRKARVYGTCMYLRY